ncbi:hypothetical protein ACSLVQ_27965, partial [Klebsiella pneumoniae]|uniref:hypothetical protein n=1 Tax=Klebsiella pneumoniae TaxID=573 RepID=UPI003EE21833
VCRYCNHLARAAPPAGTPAPDALAPRRAEVERQLEAEAAAGGRIGGIIVLVLGAGLAGLGAVLPATGAPIFVGIILGVFGALLGAVGIYAL